MHQNLPFTVWNLLRAFDPDKKGYVSKTRFYKLSYLVHTKLKKRKIQTGLPWCWYIYGPEVQIKYIPPSIYTSEEKPDGTRLFFGAEPKDCPPEPKDRAAILYEISALQKRHPRTDELVKEIYADPPKNVLSLLKDYDDLVNSIGKGQTMVDGGHVPIIISQLDRIEKSYSEDAFGEMYPEFLRLDDMIRLSMHNRPGRIGEIGQTIHLFREIVATKASALFNENLPREFADERMDLLRTRLDAFKPLLNELESDLLKDIPLTEGDRKHTGELAKVALTIAKGE